MTDAVLEIIDLHKNFGGLVVTDGVTLEIEPGELHAVIGPNGAGKTTLINQISGLIFPAAGTIHFNGADITGLPANKRAELGLARSFQITSVLPGFSGLENVALAVQARMGTSYRFFARADRDQAANDAAMAALVEVGLAGREHTLAAHLSHGEKRALELAIALAM
ncbi:MAG TPA: ATP-binding cassette domain-containing protein, partial [Pseudolabrys sp.]|nr:ATP-binding cassette domain-containing protein [Pseudolabrys sp.]